MKTMVGMLIVGAVAYQMCFRYEHWPSKEHEGVMFERDNLTGEVYTVKPGEKRNPLTRLLGSLSDSGSMLEPIDLNRENGETEIPEPEQASAAPGKTGKGLSKEESTLLHMVESTSPLPLPKEIIIAKQAPPVPEHPAVHPQENNPFAVRQIDLNADGTPEEIIQAVTEHDGLLDISIVRNGQEILFNRGRDLKILPSKNMGWSDISTVSGNTRTVFRYSATKNAYVPIVIPQNGA